MLFFTSSGFEGNGILFHEQKNNVTSTYAVIGHITAGGPSRKYHTLGTDELLN
jgi:hypothetical protein